MTLSDHVIKNNNPIVALLGPTNTGKTYLALEEMLSFDTGCIGFPLRLLARESYDKLIKKTHPQSVALITGEEKIIPANARYFICTTESMPVSKSFEFLAIDEIQLCADGERGHIYTDRLLRARGQNMTMFMGSDTMEPILKKLIPHIRIEKKTRLSQLEYIGHKKMSRLPRRTAVVAFSMDDVYALAELMKRQRGGAAVVLGALSPRARNKQVELFQSGDVDFMVATDAIGMGLNMDVKHIALAATRKYDGQKIRPLTYAEMGQISGRAGRYKKHGSFGVTGNVKALPEDAVNAIENHKFDTIKGIFWRNTALDFRSAKQLIRSLEAKSPSDIFMAARPSQDYLALTHISKRLDISKYASSVDAAQTLWECCQIPDFRKTLRERHHDFIADIYTDLTENNHIPEDKINKHLTRLQDTKGNIDTLMNRIAHTRTWTYITHKSSWLNNAAEWADKARSIEDQLSDALHDALTKKFVDKRTSILLQAKQKDGDLLGGVKATGEVIIEGHPVGKLDGLRFISDDATTNVERRAMMSSARKILKPEIKNRVRKMLKAEHSQFQLSDEGQILYQAQLNNPLPGVAIARLQKGTDQLKPVLQLLEVDLVEEQDKTAIQTRLETWLQQEIATVLEPLLPLQEGKELEGAVKGIAFQIYEALGIVRRKEMENLIADLTTDDRKILRQNQIRLGPVLAFIPALNKPAAIKLRSILWTLWHDKTLPAPVPNAGATSVAMSSFENVDPEYFQSIGYPVYGPRAIRVDMLDRVISAVFDGAEKGIFKAKHEMAEWLGCSIPDLYMVLEAMGHKKIHDPEDEKVEEDKKAESTTEDVKTEDKSDPSADTEPKADADNEADVTEEKPAEDAPTESNKPADEQARPELATFRLYRSGKRSQRKASGQKHGEDKPYNKKGKGHKKKHKGREKDRGPRVISAGPKETDAAASPFAVLEAMKGNVGKK